VRSRHHIDRRGSVRRPVVATLAVVGILVLAGVAGVAGVGGVGSSPHRAVDDQVSESHGRAPLLTPVADTAVVRHAVDHVTSRRTPTGALGGPWSTLLVVGLAAAAVAVDADRRRSLAVRSELPARAPPAR